MNAALGKHAKKFENSSETADSVWEKHVHKDFMQAVANGELAQSDGRSWKALKERYVIP